MYFKIPKMINKLVQINILHYLQFFLLLFVVYLYVANYVKETETKWWDNKAIIDKLMLITILQRIKFGFKTINKLTYSLIKIMMTTNIIKTITTITTLTNFIITIIITTSITTITITMLITINITILETTTMIIMIMVVIIIMTLSKITMILEEITMITLQVIMIGDFKK